MIGRRTAPPPFLVAALVSLAAFAAVVGLAAYFLYRDEAPTDSGGRSFVEPAPEGDASVTLEGSVTSLDDGKPLPSASVRAMPSSRAGGAPVESLVATDGSFRLAVPARFDGTLSARAPGFVEKTIHVPRKFVEEGLRFDFGLVREE